MSHLTEVQVKAILDALGELSKDAPDKKPNVKDVEGLIGFDISGDQRDVLWVAAQDDDLATKAVAEAAELDRIAAEEGATKAVAEAAVEGDLVVNKHSSPLAINGVSIPVNGSAVVAGFDADKPLIKKWLDAKIISVE